MNVEAARVLLAMVRAGMRPDTPREAIDEALRATGDLPEFGLHDQLKRAVYHASHAWAVDHEERRGVPPPAPIAFVLTDEQCAAVDEQAEIANERNPGGD